jgi:excisionase family DNA binding protein
MTDFLSTAEAAERLGTTTQTISVYLRKGRLRGFKLGKTWRINRADFERLLAGERPPVEDQEPPQTP